MGRRRHPFIWKLASILLAFLFFAEATVFAQMRAIAAARPAFTRARPPAKTTWKPPSQETLLAQMRTALAAPSAGMFARIHRSADGADHTGGATPGGNLFRGAGELIELRS